METVASMAVLIGKTVLVNFEKITVLCNVIDSRCMWDRIDLLVEPVNGRGQQWVNKSRIRIENQTEMQS